MASKDKVQERVYALHDFDAENPDEVSFKAGEAILVVEKDDAYGDGWWQGSNQRGETGLFPFSYTTYDRSAAIGLLSGGGAVAAGEDASREANGKGVKATMDDIDIALARMQAGRGVGDDAASERTGDMSVGETDENDDAEDDYEKRAKARAALAVNAAKSNDDASEADRAEQARLKAQAMRVFEEEEEKHRKLLLKKEEQRKEAAAKGALPDDKQPKSAPIPGVDMSDESDSEGSVGPDIDDAAPTHAPLFGASNAVSAATTAAALKPQQSRALSPIPSDDVHARAREATNKNGNVFSQRTEELEDRSVDSSRLSGSPALGRSNNTAPSAGTAPTSVVGNDTPRSSHATAVQMSPAPSATGSRGLGPGGDPHEWTVEQVVEWGRSKGWDEPSIVSKFAEHEISGDVLMEMDANILKEIEITAFGKRFQVANAIKELKRSLTQDANQSQFSTPVVDSNTNTMQQQQQQQQQTRNFSQPMSEMSSHNTEMSSNANPFGGLGAPINGLPLNTQRTTSQQSAQDPSPSPFRAIQPDLPENSGDTYPSTFGSASGEQSGGQDRFRPDSMGSLQGKSSFSPDNSISYSNFNQQHASSPRRRESAGSSLKSPTERTSFFAGLSGQRNRKPAPQVKGGAPPAPAEPDNMNNKGTLSRLGFNRLKGSQGSDTANSQDLRNKISLPTGSPTFDAMGDTARRHRLSHLGPTGAPNIPGFSGHQRQASVGSGGPGAADWHTPNEPRSPGNMAQEGAVMVRIRPVDYEGWMRKKGERYNSWKPRYMALKGSDLVLLRDPTAPKIKGYVNMRGYKVIADETTNPGKYGFKILHETEKPHYFSSDDALAVRDWMKALMKATIGRDTTLPVISSYNNATISLKEAQRMNPPPRPPSPTSRARAQRAAARANKDQLTAKDASVLMVSADF
jgi:hypothetical protein